MGQENSKWKFEDKSCYHQIDFPSKPYNFMYGRFLKSFETPVIRLLTIEDGRNMGSTLVPSYIFPPELRETDPVDHRQMVIDYVFPLVDVHHHVSALFDLSNNQMAGRCVSYDGRHLALITSEGVTYLGVCQSDNLFTTIKKTKRYSGLALVAKYTCCAFSPNGKWLVAALCTDYHSDRFNSHVVVHQVKQLFQKHTEKYVHFADHYTDAHYPCGVLLDLCFSQDSSLLAASSSRNKVYLFETKTWKLLRALEQFDTEAMLSSMWGLLPPMCKESIITCNDCGKLGTWLIAEKDVVQKARIIKEDEFRRISCTPKLSPDGSLLAVGFTNSTIMFINCDNFQPLWSIDAPDFSSIQHLSEYDNVPVLNLHFSKSCLHLSITYDKEIPAICPLPYTKFSLKHLCRCVIISSYPPNEIHKLPIPNTMKQYLLYLA